MKVIFAMDYTEEERRILLTDCMETDEPSFTQVEFNQEIHDGAPDRFSLAILFLKTTTSIGHELKQLPCSNQNLHRPLYIHKTALKNEM